MSGSTRVTQASELHTLTLETPCVSFAPGPPGPDGRPDPDEGAQEQRYHSAARARLEAALAPLDPGLGQALAAIRSARPELGLLPWSADLPLVGCFEEWALTRYREAGGGPCRLAQRLTSARDLDHPAPGGLDGTLELAFAALPAQEVAERLRDEVAAEVDRLCRAARPPAVETPPPPPPPAPGDAGLLGLALAFLLGTALATGALLALR